MSSPSCVADFHHQHNSQQLPVVEFGVSCFIAMLAIYELVNNTMCSDLVHSAASLTSCSLTLANNSLFIK